MLVLSRKVNEEIVIGDNIRVRLVKIGGGRARLGISAPPEISVHRAELARKRPALAVPLASAAGELRQKLLLDR